MALEMGSWGYNPPFIPGWGRPNVKELRFFREQGRSGREVWPGHAFHFNLME